MQECAEAFFTFGDARVSRGFVVVVFLAFAIGVERDVSLVAKGFDCIIALLVVTDLNGAPGYVEDCSQPPTRV